MSRSLLTSIMMSCRPIACAAACTSLRSASVPGTFRFTKHANRRCLGNDLAQQLQSLRPDLAAEPAHAGDVAARPVEAGDEAVLDRIGAGSEDDRHRRCCGLGRERRTAVHHDHGHRQANQIRHQRRQAINLILRIAIFDRDVLPRRRSLLPSGLGRTREQGARMARATCCGGSRSPASPVAARARRAAKQPPRRQRA